jgi:Rps23 Pro-64 3,4-dihydroxylase Tpa1-like proline 4-hydroxylase
MLNDIKISPEEYQSIKPYPYYYMDNCMDNNFATELQNEILNIDKEAFDRYENPFETKFTFRDKFNYPPNLNKLINYLEDDNFIDKLSMICGYKLIKDNERNFNGIHIYNNGDKLDIHVDAGIYHKNGLKKQLTLGIYLSYDWKPEYGCELEVWKGDNAGEDNPKLEKCVFKIAPIFNRLILFTNNDYSWHGNPEPVKNNNTNAKRIFITISYLSDNLNDKNKRNKAYFIARPNDLPNEEKDRLRLLRADPLKYKDVYKYTI